MNRCSGGVRQACQGLNVEWPNVTWSEPPSIFAKPLIQGKNTCGIAVAAPLRIRQRSSKPPSPADRIVSSAEMSRGPRLPARCSQLRRSAPGDAVTVGRARCASTICASKSGSGRWRRNGPRPRAPARSVRPPAVSSDRRPVASSTRRRFGPLASSSSFEPEVGAAVAAKEIVEI
ncbi:MAG: hypothetical protein DMG07_23190 [Acidobacteria bacterium]|nr:MAG: hypothetical protein DMG07_23190 [Acidobacteriota bacterium]